jgi:hypothetical protein
MKAAAEERRTTIALIQETNDIAKAIQSTPSSKASYRDVLL